MRHGAALLISLSVSRVYPSQGAAKPCAAHGSELFGVGHFGVVVEEVIRTLRVREIDEP